MLPSNRKERVKLYGVTTLSICVFMISIESIKCCLQVFVIIHIRQRKRDDKK